MLLKQVIYFYGAMKKHLKSYTTYTRKERAGLLALFILLGILIFIRTTMHFWVHPDFEDVENKRLAEQWDSFKQKNAQIQFNDSILEAQRNWLDQGDADEDAKIPDTININTADSALLVRLKGIGPVTAGKIVHFREENGPFKTVDGLLDVYHIRDSVFAVIRKHLSVK